MSQSLVFDIGNTNITIGIFEDTKITMRARLTTDTSRTLDEFEIQIDQLLQRHSFKPSENLKIIIACVVPALSAVFEDLSLRLFKINPVHVGPLNCGGISINVPNPQSVGADRIANAVAAGILYSKPCLVVDFGTATTFDVVSYKGAYEGGIIAPGLETSLTALVQRASKLSKVELSWPTRVMGKSTEEAMQSGLVLGYLSLIDGLIEKLQTERGDLGKVVATGGLGGFFVEHSKYISLHDADLTLFGLKTIGDFQNV